MDLKQISDDELWNRTRDLASRERQLTLEVLHHLREIEARGLHFDRGYPSLYEYAVRELKYSEGAAYRRVQAMRALREIPEIEKKIEQGSLNLTTVSKIQTNFRNKPKEMKLELMAAVEGKSAKEVDHALAQLQTEKRFNETTRWLAQDTIELRVFLDKLSFFQLDALKAVKSHSKDAQTYSGLVKRLIELGCEKWDPERRNAPPQQRSTASGNVEYSDPRYITPALRWEVRKRDQNRCSYVNPETGVACGSKYLLQIDHIQPIALGGKTELANLRLLCAAHNQRRAKKTFGAPAEKANWIRSQDACAGTESRRECSPDPS